MSFLPQTSKVVVVGGKPGELDVVTVVQSSQILHEESPQMLRIKISFFI